MAIKERPPLKAKKRAKATKSQPPLWAKLIAPKKSTRATTLPKPKAAKKSPPSPRRRAAVPTSPPAARPRGPLRLKVGIHAGVSHLDYHADPAPEPSMSASFLRKISESSPRHAWLTHPRLNPEWKDEEPTREMDFGTAAHAHLLGSQPIQIVRHSSWRTDAARMLRDRSRAAGMAPVLERDAVTIGHMARALRAGLKGTPLDGVFDPGFGVDEAVAIWRDEGVYFRARADRWIPPAPGAWPHGLIVDYKTTFDSASAEEWSNRAFGIGADWQSVLYPEGFAMAMMQAGAKVQHDLPAFVYVVQEAFEPYEFHWFKPSAILREHTKGKISLAFATAHAALRDAKQGLPVPGYPRLTVNLEPPAWELKRAERAALTAQMMWKP